MASLDSSYQTLGLHPTATKEEVKEAFRKLVWQTHPDKAPAAERPAAEAKFKEVKEAYEAILRRRAGYSAPPPGSPPNPAFAEAYWRAHSSDGRVPWGKYGGYETELGFYRAAVKGGRNSLLVLTLAGLVAIPVITTAVMFVQQRAAAAAGDGESGGAPPAQQWGSFKEAGLDSLREAHRVNGRVSFNSPFAARDAFDAQRRAAARAAKEGAAAQQQEAGAAAAGPAS